MATLALIGWALTVVLIRRSSPDLVPYETGPIGPNWQHVKLLVPSGWKHRMAVSVPDTPIGTMIMPEDPPKWVPRPILKIFRINSDDIGFISILLDHPKSTDRPLRIRTRSKWDARIGKRLWIADMRGNLGDLCVSCAYFTEDKEAFDRNYRRMASSLRLVRY